MDLEKKIQEEVNKLEGPIVIFGAGGFIGANLFRKILEYREDVYAVTSKPFVPWRLDGCNSTKIIQCNITKKNEMDHILDQYRFQTIFMLAAYGAHSKQSDTELVHETNYMGLLNLIESASQYSLKAFVNAGTSSEYGLNAAGPKEDSPLIPNSHYAVAKASAAQMIKFYGSIKGFPILNLRYYSIYGPYEEPDRLIPQLLEKGNIGCYPPLVQPDITRDFVYVLDCVYATLLAANSDFEKTRGQSINIASGKKTTIRDIASTVKTLFDLKIDPEWGDFSNRKGDLKEMYGNPETAKKLLNWFNETSLIDGLCETWKWQENYATLLYEKKIVQDKIRHKLSAVIACYKDAEAMPIMYQRLSDTFKKIGVDYEIIFVNDASPDHANEVLEELTSKDDKVIGIEHSRNFGSQAAFLSGMEISTGHGVVLLDGDLQDPPELIEEFYKKYLEGYDVVYGRRVAREGNQVLVQFYKIFYRIFRNVSYVPIPLDAGDFSLMDRKVIEELVKLPETDQFMRGLRAWVGFKQTGVDYVRPERMFGVTTNNWRKNLAWARKAIFSFSYVPLELLTYLGGFLTIVSFLAIILQVTLYFSGANIPHGVTSIICLILFFGGIQMLGIAIIGEYQSKIIEEVKRRPKFIRKKIIKSKF